MWRKVKTLNSESEALWVTGPSPLQEARAHGGLCEETRGRVALRLGQSTGEAVFLEGFARRNFELSTLAGGLGSPKCWTG